MSLTPADTTEIAKPKGPREAFVNLLKLAAKEYYEAAPASIPKKDQLRVIERCAVAFRASAARDPKLYACTPASVGRAFAFCALAGLSPGGVAPEVYLIPRKSRIKVNGAWADGPMELEIQVGWRGFTALALRSGCRAKPVAVFEADDFDFCEGLTPTLTHRPELGAERTWETLVAVYVVAVYKDGSRDFRIIPRSEIQKRRDSSDAYQRDDKGTSPWAKWPIEMALKTGVRYAAARGLLPLDDIARLAMEEDERHVETVSLAAPLPVDDDPPLQIGEGLDALEAELAGETREAVPVERAEAPKEKAAKGAKKDAAKPTDPPTGAQGSLT